MIHPYELDIYLPDEEIAIEYCGLFWHCELKQPKKSYHSTKLQKCNEKGIRLITVFENEWREDTESLGKRILASISTTPPNITETRKTIDLRWEDEQQHIDAGYRVVKRIEPQFYYIKNGQNDFFDQSILAGSPDYDPSISIHQNMNNHGYYRIYDCGHLELTL